MTTSTPQPARSQPTPRCNADYRWTTKKVTAFLRALARCGKVAEAAREVGMSRQAAHVLKARLADPRFQEMWALALRTGWAAREEARRPASPWGDPGLVGLAHLRGAGPSAQVDALAAQADTLPRQADTLARKVTF
ncbi:MAG: hypothetical protein ABIT10_12530 [Alteraurantiacibacter sp.]